MFLTNSSLFLSMLPRHPSKGEGGWGALLTLQGMFAPKMANCTSVSLLSDTLVAPLAVRAVPLPPVVVKAPPAAVI